MFLSYFQIVNKLWLFTSESKVKLLIKYNNDIMFLGNCWEYVSSFVTIFDLTIYLYYLRGEFDDYWSNREVYDGQYY